MTKEKMVSGFKKKLDVAQANYDAAWDVFAAAHNARIDAETSVRYAKRASDLVYQAAYTASRDAHEVYKAAKSARDAAEKAYKSAQSTSVRVKIEEL